MMKILIGHDGSQSADAAMIDLQRAGLPDEAEALVVSVADVMMVPTTTAYEVAGDALMSRRVSSGLAYAQRQTASVLGDRRGIEAQFKNSRGSYQPHSRQEEFEQPRGIGPPRPRTPAIRLISPEPAEFSTPYV